MGMRIIIPLQNVRIFEVNNTPPFDKYFKRVILRILGTSRLQQIQKMKPTNINPKFLRVLILGRFFGTENRELRSL